MTEQASSVSVSKRFSLVNEDERSRILVNSDAINTRKSMERGYKLLDLFTREKQLKSPKNMTNDELDTCLSDFFFSVKTADGKLFKKTTLTSTRWAIGRYLEVDLKDVKLYPQSNKVYTAIVKELKREGKGSVDHHPPVQKADLEKCYAYFTARENLDNPKILQQKVFFDLLLRYFC